MPADKDDGRQAGKDALLASREMVGRLLDLVAMNAAHRMQAGAFGEVTIRVLWERGVIKNVRFVEESIMRSPDEIRAQGT